jgi:hypothetical protein
VLSTEATAPNRDTADRPSYAAVVKRAAPSVVAVIAPRKERPAAAIATAWRCVGSLPGRS